MKIAVHDRPDAVGAAAWTALHGRTRLRSPFLGWTWQTEWLRAFGGGHRVEIWRVDDTADAPLALLPLHEVDPGRWQLIGGVDVSDYLDLIAPAGREEEVWGALLSARASRADTWDLHSVPAASPTVAQVPGIAAAFGLSATVDLEERCPVLALPASWDAYLEQLPGKQRHELRRKIRRLEREAPDAHPISLAEADGIAARFDDFLALHRQSRVGKARFMDGRMERFFRDATAALARENMLRLWFLDAPGGPLASFITIEWDGTVGLYNSGFRPDAAALSPGLVLLAHLIRDAIGRGRRRFDFLRGEERYKYDFGPVPEDVCRVQVTAA